LRKSLQNLCNMHVVHFVYFYQIFEKHENDIAKQTRLPTKLSILKLLEYQDHKLVEIFTVF